MFGSGYSFGSSQLFFLLVCSLIAVAAVLLAQTFA